MNCSASRPAMSRYMRWMAFFASLLALAGCGGSSTRPTLGKVFGVVTYEGKPLSNAQVVFNSPEAKSSLGLTDEGGRYELNYIRDIKGAAVGVHKVEINTFGQAAPKLAPRYNVNSELTATVEPGENEINFDLTAPGS